MRLVPIRPWVSASRLLAVAICAGFAIVFASWYLAGWNHHDTEAYLDAALRLRHGLPLYPALHSVNSPLVYRYAPWFAYLWIPLTYLPRALVLESWSAVLVAATAAACWPLLSSRTFAGIAAGALLGGLLLLAAADGNVQPVIVAMLVWTLQRRSGAVAIAIAASLKGFPILLCLAYIGQRQWRRLAVAVGLTIGLLVPMALAGLAHYPFTPGATLSLLDVSPVAFGAGAALTGVGALVAAARGSRFTWLAASLAVLASLPRLALYDFSFLLAGMPAEGAPARAAVLAPLPERAAP